MSTPPPPSEGVTAGESTSLELPATPSVPHDTTSLELPDAEPPTAPESLDIPGQSTSAPPADVPTHAAATPAGAALGNLAIAHFQRVEVAMLSRVLAGTLAGALPASMLTVQRHRSVAERLSGKPGVVVGVSVTAYDKSLTLRARDVGDVEASVSHIVRGIVLSTTTVSISQWLAELASLLNQVSEEDRATRLALESALLR